MKKQRDPVSDKNKHIRSHTNTAFSIKPLLTSISRFFARINRFEKVCISIVSAALIFFMVVYFQYSAYGQKLPSQKQSFSGDNSFASGFSAENSQSDNTQPGSMASDKYIVNSEVLFAVKLDPEASASVPRAESSISLAEASATEAAAPEPALSDGPAPVEPAPAEPPPMGSSFATHPPPAPAAETAVNIDPQPEPTVQDNPPVIGNIPILAPPSASLAQAQAWARNKGASQLFIDLAALFWNLYMASGVDPAVAYAQSALETNYGRFTGVLDASYCNPCGIKTSAGGGDYDPAAHQRFPDWSTGITAQYDHLALYAGCAGYPKSVTPDPRHFPILNGTAPCVVNLGGKWAPSPDYGTILVNSFLLPMKNTVVD